LMPSLSIWCFTVARRTLHIDSGHLKYQVDNQISALPKFRKPKEEYFKPQVGKLFGNALKMLTKIQNIKLTSTKANWKCIRKVFQIVTMSPQNNVAENGEAILSIPYSGLVTSSTTVTQY
jgi:hypothetical protein